MNEQEMKEVLAITSALWDARWNLRFNVSLSGWKKYCLALDRNIELFLS